MSGTKLEILQKLLQKKFGPLSESIRDKLAALTPEEMTQTIEQILDVDTLEELGL